MHRFTRCVLFTVLMVGGLSPRVPAQDTWTGASGPLWTTDGNWFLFAAPLPGADVALDANTVGNFATVLGVDYSLNSLTLADPPAAMSISSNLLTLGAGGVNMAAALQNLTINSRVVAATAQTWSVNAGALLQVAGRLEGPGALTKLGAGTVSFSANGTANVYSGDVVVAEGTLLLDGGANSYPFGLASNGVRTVTVLSNAVLTAANVTHNPLGAGSVFAMLLVLLAQVGSGLVSDDEISFTGPLNRFVSSANGLLATWYHKQVGQWLIIGLVVLHITAILFYLWRKKDNLIKPMLSGDKPGSAASSRDDAQSRLVAAVIFGICTAFVYWLVTLRA